MKNYNEILNILEGLAKEHHKESEKLREQSKAFASQYYAGKAAGIETAIGLIRICANEEIPFDT